MIYLEAATYTDVKQAASYANVSAPTIRAWIADGSLESFKLGGAHIIKLEWLEDAMQIARRPGPKTGE